MVVLNMCGMKSMLNPPGMSTIVYPEKSPKMISWSNAVVVCVVGASSYSIRGRPSREPATA